MAWRSIWNALDSSQIAVPPAPALASEAYATELVEMYWASLLRDVPFTTYAADPVASQAAAELSAMPAYAGPRDAAGQVTPELLFRGNVRRRADRPLYLAVSSAANGVRRRCRSSRNTSPTSRTPDFMLDPAEFLKVQNGIATGKVLTPHAALYLHDGRGLAAYTHEDVLYQAYFIAFLVLSTLKVPPNPGNPYIGSTTAERLRHDGRTGYRRDAGRGGRGGDQVRVVPEMVGAPAPPPGIGRRDRASA